MSEWRTEKVDAKLDAKLVVLDGSETKTLYPVKAWVRSDLVVYFYEVPDEGHTVISFRDSELRVGGLHGEKLAKAMVG